MAAPTPKEFFRVLWDGMAGGHVQLSLARPHEGQTEQTRIYFPWPTGLDDFIEASREAPGWEAFYGIALRSEPTERQKHVLAVPALWHTFNLSLIPMEKAIALLKAFPFKASAGVMSGKLLQIYWLLAEPLGREKWLQTDGTPGLSWLRSVLPANSRLTKFLAPNLPEKADLDPLLAGTGLQAIQYDPDGILRIPGCLDHECSPPEPFKIVTWRPEVRHKFADILEHLLSGGKSVTAPATSSPPPAATSDYGMLAPAAPDTKKSSLPSPVEPSSADEGETREIPPDLNQRLAHHMSKLWIDSFREKVTMLIAGALAHGSYSENSAVRLVQAVCTLTGDVGTASFESLVRRTFERHASGAPVGGWPSLEKLVEEFPGALRDEAKKAFEAIRKSVPKTKKGADGGGTENGRGRHVEPDFELILMTRFESQPARYRIRLKLLTDEIRSQWKGLRETNGKGLNGTSPEDTLEISVEEDQAYDFGKFRPRTFGQTHLYIADITQTRWEEMVRKAPFERVEAPPEANPAGAIASALEDFMENKKEAPEIGDLKSFPGYDEGHVFFRLITFKNYLKDQSIRFTDREVIDELKRLTWERGTKRFGQDTAKLWTKEIKVEIKATTTLFDRSEALDKKKEEPSR